MIMVQMIYRHRAQQYFDAEDLLVPHLLQASLYVTVRLDKPIAADLGFDSRDEVLQQMRDGVRTESAERDGFLALVLISSCRS